ncbi:acetoacetyl-CoA reductase [Ramlibacter alkalitolerans]|uniref:Acetoacetyl-CoA reductase n=1 Tax=Ramlibacter alkalitolerans TaxID=2039631 RepID=A0ABS1JMC0_9BURK|nr:acetoacetyl-CoA reductase [Ramlibacter alkalitolerans]MBL0425393.1 acetoacetyl-CoA reductase [Ramlibacter alkalitolerans]
MSRIALVTGGTRGIGAATALVLKQAGYRVAVTYAGNEAGAQRFREATDIPAYQWSVADFAACQRGVDRLATELGPVEILVNNAGVTHDSMLHKMTHEAWESVIGIDLGGCFNMCRAVIGGMRARSFGRIVNIGSVNGQQGQVGQANYAAAKAGILGFTKALALETASHGITVNAIAPGYTATDMVTAVPAAILETIVARIPVGRLGKPEEIARAVLFLVADEAGFITGSTLSVNGGQHME